MRSPFVFGRLGRTYRNVVRLRRILEVLRAEGFGYVVVRMNLHKLIRFPKRLGARFVAGVGPRIYGCVAVRPPVAYGGGSRLITARVGYHEN